VRIRTSLQLAVVALLALSALAGCGSGSGITTSNIAGTYTGTSQNTGGSSIALSMTITQLGSIVSITGNSGSNAFTGSGTIIGTTLSASLSSSTSNPLGFPATNIAGTVNGTTISGSTVEPASDFAAGASAVNGTFTMTD